MLEKNRVYHGDCFDVMKQIPDKSIDLTVTSPPYDNLREYGGNMGRGNEKREGVLSELYRATKEGGVVVWVVGDATIEGGETGSSFRQALHAMELGFILHDTMIYEKNTSSFPARKDGNRYTQIFEYMFVFSKGKPKTHNLIIDKKNNRAGHTNRGKNTQRGKDGELVASDDINPVPDMSPRNNIWKYIVGGGFGQRDSIAYEHPATYPIELARDHILTWSNRGDLVLDPFLGSGTTAVACKELGRDFIGIEMNEEYVGLANKRLDSTFISLF